MMGMDMPATFEYHCSIVNAAGGHPLDASADDRNIAAHLAERLKDCRFLRIESHLIIEIPQCIPRERKLRKNNSIGAFVARTFAPFKVLCNVTLYIAKERADLRKRYAGL